MLDFTKNTDGSFTNMQGFSEAFSTGQPALALPPVLQAQPANNSWSAKVWSGLQDAGSSMGDYFDGDWLDSTDPKTGITTQGKLGGLTAAAGAISNAYLGYQGLKEAQRSREMQEKYAAANLANSATAYNANVRDVADNNAAINNWDDERRQAYINSNQAQGTV